MYQHCQSTVSAMEFKSRSWKLYPGCQRLFSRGFRFLSSFYSDPRFASPLVASAYTAEDVSAVGQHRRFPPHARKTNGQIFTPLCQ